MALQAAGALATLVAIVHGALAELQVFAKTHIESRSVRTLLRMVWQASTIAWIGIGVLLIIAPTLGSEIGHRWIIGIAVVAYSYGALGNATTTRGRHIGWCLMGTVVVLALTGL